MGSHRGIGEVQDLQDDMHPTHPPSNFERIDPFVKEVTEELGPGALLLAGAVPDPRFTGAVVTAGASSRIGAVDECVSGGTLVPEASGDRPAGRRGNRLGEVHT